MKKAVVILIGFTIISLSISGQTTRKALFLGNSYTSLNNLPQLVSDMAKSVGDTLIHDSYAPGGYTLLNHSLNSISTGKIMLGSWDYVVLQEQSQLPSTADFSPTGDYLNNLVKQYNPCARLMLYMTWGRKNGDAVNCPSWPPVCTYLGMDSLLRLRYLEMGQLYHGEVSPVGAVWRYIRQTNPGINLYLPDESHPTPEGSYAAACCFYTAIFKKDPTFIPYNFTISPTDAAFIRAATKHIVYDSLAKWDFVNKIPVAKFKYTIGQGMNEVIFNNQSENATSYLWDFGDGTTSTIKYPIHNYLSNGIYTITLTASNCDITNVYQHTAQAKVSFCPFTPVIYPNNLVLCPNSSDTLWTQVYDAYQWLDQNGDSIPNATGRFFIPSGGLYSIIATQNNCTEISTQVNADKYLVNAQYYVSEIGNPDIPGGKTACIGDTIQLVISPNKPPYPDDQSIEWLRDGQPILGSQNDTLDITTSGNYAVRIKSNFCPGYFDYESDAYDYTFVACPTGISEALTDTGLEVYPNPSGDFCTIYASPACSGQEYALYDTFGQVVCRGKLNGPVNTLNLRGLSIGMYILKTENANVRILKSQGE